ncbi:MAG: rhomboid family intramembrane serine protease [Eubacterium sp.]|nr:rhomboid family intramembrane serine protease [Eubacterium sp.]
MNDDYIKRENDYTTLESQEKPYVTYALLIINVLVFIAEMINGGAENTQTLLNMGAEYWPSISEDGEWYRMFTSMFLHIGIDHLVGNMICLIAIGPNVEHYFGHVKYTIIYLLSGLCGSFLSLLVELFTMNFYVSAGASGALSGLFGAMIIFSMDPATKKYFSKYKIIIYLALLLIPGFGPNRVNIMAHLGGIIGGFIIAYFFYYTKKKKNNSTTPEF